MAGLTRGRREARHSAEPPSSALCGGKMYRLHQCVWAASREAAAWLATRPSLPLAINHMIAGTKAAMNAAGFLQACSMSSPLKAGCEAEERNTRGRE